jgi:hypothetical protein
MHQAEPYATYCTANITPLAAEVWPLALVTGAETRAE